MKKKWLSILALMTCLTVGVGSFVGCGKSGIKDSSKISQDSEVENSESQSTGDMETGEKPLSKDEIYAIVMQAEKNTAKHQGAVTFDFNQQEKETRGEKITMRERVERQSINPTEKQAYTRGSLTQVYNGETSVSVSVAKIFKEGDSYYRASGEVEFDDANVGGDLVALEKYWRVTDAFAEQAMGNSGIRALSLEELGFPINISSVDEWNAAFAEVFASSKAEVEAGTQDENSEWYQRVVDGGCVLTCEEKGDEFIVKMYLEAAVLDTEEANVNSAEMEVVAKNGYITKILMKNWSGYASSSATNGLDEITQYDSEYEVTYSYTIGYEFDQAGYDGIITTLPDNVEDYEEGGGFATYLDVYINGVQASGGRSVWGDDEQDAYTDFMNSVGQWYDGMDIAWYTDEACTMPFTVADLGKVDAIYGKATLKEGCAFIITKESETYASDVPEAYKLVFETINGALDWDEDIEARSTDYALDVYEEAGVTVTVNGEVVTFTEADNGWKNIPMTAGETYVVEYVKAYTKAEINIFKIL